MCSNSRRIPHRCSSYAAQALQRGMHGFLCEDHRSAFKCQSGLLRGPSWAARVSQEMIQGWRRWHKTLLCFPTQWKHRNPGTGKKRVAVRTHLSIAQRSVYSASCSDSICNLAQRGLIRATKRAFAHIYGAKPRFGCNGSTAYFDTHPPPQKISFGITSKPNIFAPPPLWGKQGSFCAGHHLPPI